MTWEDYGKYLAYRYYAFTYNSRKDNIKLQICQIYLIPENIQQKVYH